MAQPNLPQYKLSALPGQVTQSISSLTSSLSESMKNMGARLAEKKKKDEAAEAKALEDSYSFEKTVAESATNANTDVNNAIESWGRTQASAISNKQIDAYSSGGNAQMKKESNQLKLASDIDVKGIGTFSQTSTSDQKAWSLSARNTNLSGANSIGTLSDDANYLAQNRISDAQNLSTNKATDVSFETLKNGTVEFTYKDNNGKVQTRNVTAQNAAFMKDGRDLNHYVIKSENAIGNWSNSTYTTNKRENLFDNFKEKIEFKDQKDGTWKTKVTVKGNEIMAAAEDENSDIYKALTDDINSNASSFFQTYATMRQSGLISEEESLNAPWSITEVNDEDWEKYTKKLSSDEAKKEEEDTDGYKSIVGKIDTDNDDSISRTEFKKYQMGLAVKGLATKYSQIYGDLQKVEAIQEKEVIDKVTGGYNQATLTTASKEYNTYTDRAKSVRNLFANASTSEQVSKQFADGMNAGRSVKSTGKDIIYMNGADIIANYGGVGGVLNNAITSGQISLSPNKVYTFEMNGSINPTTVPREYGGFNPDFVKFENGKIKDPSTLEAIILDEGYGYGYADQYLMGTEQGKKKIGKI